MEMQKMVLKLYLNEDRDKKKTMIAVTSLSGVESIAMDTENKLTVTGTVDLITVVKKLRKICRTDVLSVGPAKEPAKELETKKDGPEKEEDKQIEDFIRACTVYNPYWRPYPYVHCADENPNACVIC